MEKFIENLINRSRWILVVFYIGLLVALVLFALFFIGDIVHVGKEVIMGLISGNGIDHQEMLLLILGIIEMVMLANLINIVKTGSYSIFVKKSGNDHTHEIAWINHVDPGILKIKVSMALVNIAGVYLLSDFVHTQNVAPQIILIRALLYVVLVVGSLILAKTDKIAE